MYEQPSGYADRPIPEREHRPQERHPRDPRLVSRGGTRWEQRNSSASLYLMHRKLGLPMFGWHRLRHTFATNYLRQGGDIVRLSMVLGHTQITTTQRYLHLLTEDLSASHQKVSILNRLG